jgi:hypothetical protein
LELFYASKGFAMFRALTLITAATLISASADVQAQTTTHRIPGERHVHHHSPRSAFGFALPTFGPAARGGDVTSFGYGGGGNFGYPGTFPGNGYGYMYDPYAGGSFKPPSLLDDPFFRADHKFESAFPGRYRTTPSPDGRGHYHHRTR